MPYYRSGWSKPWGQQQRYSRYTPQGWPTKQPAFYWRCGSCQNVQTGSECKGCRTKYWHLPSWERVAKPEHTKGWGQAHTDHRHHPTGTSHSHQTIADVIFQLTHPKPGEDPTDPNLLHHAQALHKGLLSRCTVEEKHRRLQSVVSKLEHCQKQLGKSQEEESKLQEKLQSLREDRTALIKKTEDLENERQELLKVVNSEGDNPLGAKADEEMDGTGDTDSQASTQLLPGNKRVRRSQPNGFRPTPSHPPADPTQWMTSLTNLPPDLLQQLITAAQQEATARQETGFPGGTLPPGYGDLTGSGVLDPNGHQPGTPGSLL